MGAPSPETSAKLSGHDRQNPDAAVTPGEFATQRVTIAGHDLLTHHSGGLYWPSQNLLIVSDLHLEKGSARAFRGHFLPPYDTRETLLRLSSVIDEFAPETVVSLGDSFHDTDGCRRMCGQDLELLQKIQSACDWIWVTGNHDPKLADRVGGTVVGEIAIDGICLRHEPQVSRARHEIAGHLHPAARLSTRGTSLRRPCFVGNGQRLILPAFGAFTGGLNVLDEAFAPIFAQTSFSVWLLGADGVYPVPTRQLRGDRRS